MNFVGLCNQSRLVVRGFKPHEEVDFGEMFVLNVNSCVRLLSEITCKLDLFV